MIIFNAFGNKYPVSDEGMRLSQVLSASYSGKFKDVDNEIMIDLEPEFKPALEALVNYMNKPNEPIKKLKGSDLLNFLSLADYLSVTSVINKVVNNLSETSNNEALAISLEFSHLPEVSSYASQNIGKYSKPPKSKLYREEIVEINRVGNWFKNLNNANRDLLNKRKGKLDERPIFFKTLYPHDGTIIEQVSKSGKTFLNLMPKGWAAKCQKANKPEVIKDFSTISKLIGEGVNFMLFTDQDGEGHYVRCPGKKSFDNITNDGKSLPCCSQSESVAVMDKAWGKLKTVVTDDGWLVLTNKNFVGDYLLIWKPIIFEDLGIIIDTR